MTIMTKTCYFLCLMWHNVYDVLIFFIKCNYELKKHKIFYDQVIIVYFKCEMKLITIITKGIILEMLTKIF
jgi:hypothetical protein